MGSEIIQSITAELHLSRKPCRGNLMIVSVTPAEALIPDTEIPSSTDTEEGMRRGVGAENDSCVDLTRQI